MLWTSPYFCRVLSLQIVNRETPRDPILRDVIVDCKAGFKRMEIPSMLDPIGLYGSGGKLCNHECLLYPWIYPLGNPRFTLSPCKVETSGDQSHEALKVRSWSHTYDWTRGVTWPG